MQLHSRSTTMPVTKSSDFDVELVNGRNYNVKDNVAEFTLASYISLLEKVRLHRHISHQGVVARGEGVVGEEGKREEEHHWPRLVP